MGNCDFSQHFWLFNVSNQDSYPLNCYNFQQINRKQKTIISLTEFLHIHFLLIDSVVLLSFQGFYLQLKLFFLFLGVWHGAGIYPTTRSTQFGVIIDKNKDDPLCVHFLGWWEQLKTFVLVLSEQTAEKWGALFLSSYFCYPHQH